jgi:hypothetical protein
MSTAPADPPKRPPSDEYDGLSSTFARACREADAQRRQQNQPGKIIRFPRVEQDGVRTVPSAAALQRVYEDTIAKQRAEHGPAASTLMAADFLFKLGDRKRLKQWLAGRSAEEKRQLYEYLKKKITSDASTSN